MRPDGDTVRKTPAWVASLSSGRQMVWLALEATPGIGLKTLSALASELDRRGIDASELSDATRSELEGLGLKPKLAVSAEESLSSLPEETAVEDGLLVPGDDGYPTHRLGRRAAVPVLLRCRGDVGLLAGPSIAFSGARNAGTDALDFVRDLINALAGHDLTIASGNAVGIDAAAHQAAVDAGLPTITVPATGLGSFEPSFVYDEAFDRVLAVSQFRNDAPWIPRQAMQRNETIAALSDAVIVVAAGKSGGSLAMGEMCLKANLPLLVPRIADDYAAGNRLLLESGAVVLPFGDVDDAVSIIQDALASAEGGTDGHEQQSLFGGAPPS